MGFFDKALKTAKNVGTSIAEGAANAGSTAGTTVQEAQEVNSIKMELNVINQELDSAYAQVGKRFVDYIIKTGDTGNVDVSDLLTLMDPKLQRKQELEDHLVDVEKRIKQNAILRDKARAKNEFEKEKTKLDRALAMDVITEEEYNNKLNSSKKKLDNFEEIRRIEQQCDMGIITAEEKKAKIDALLK